MAGLSEAQRRALKLFERATDDPDRGGMFVLGSTEFALRQRGLIEDVPGRLVSRITSAGRAALKDCQDG